MPSYLVLVCAGVLTNGRIESELERSVRRALLTHSHFDHAGGLEQFRNLGPVLVHPNARKRLEADGVRAQWVDVEGPIELRLDDEVVRVWHPGQSWIFEPGGLGVFDPGINALSILTRILPEPVFVAAAELCFPANREAPIAATLSLTDRTALPITAEFDFRQTGPQTWNISVVTDDGQLLLSSGGRRLALDDEVRLDGTNAEYPSLYRRFLELSATSASDVDLAPLRLVADAFLLGRRCIVEPFED